MVESSLVPSRKPLAHTLPDGFRLRIALAAANHLSAIRRLVSIGQRAGVGVDQLLAEAQRFGALGLSLTESVQRDLVWWRVKRHVLDERPS